MNQFNTVIIGGGPAGLGLAYPLHSAGQKVAVVEENKWGGTCPNRGCDPKKVLLGAVEAQVKSDQLVGRGLNQTPQINWPQLMKFKQTFTDPVSDNSRAGLVSAGIEVFDGHASFVDEHTLSVGEQTITADRFVIATGQRPGRLNVPGDEYLLTSTDFLSLPTMPAKIAFIGGGYIAFELAAIAAVAGAEVHIIHHNERPLKQFAQAAVAELMNQLEAKGVQFDLNVETQSIKREADQTVIQAPNYELTVDQAFVTSGRVANADTLNLAAIGVEADRHGIVVNDHLQTAQPNIYAMGDVVAKRIPKLTPVSGFEAAYLSQELVESGAAIHYPEIPTVVFGMPRLAQVGISWQTAQEQSDKYRSQVSDMTNWFTYKHLNEPLAKAWMVVDKQTDQIVGATVISNEAETLVNYLTQIINTGQTMKQVKEQVFLYPTEASDLEYLG
ncbi:pyruvate 2-oxoglutarate dehydrogenase complex [Lentilactobacillus senioris DSM 24302 = JCM 17472]|uniref:Pyruvate 2-oxoglutarate dehydrogenase complex n=1 Tax=Lentilactobacillus senioris DSM 24302 = JCM 17472 TaxID=1423802 RepID=A0A0R2CSM4_9LACO|nr:NAD(P)/FAD-dependent oxidoreductase [Lentilactobacillus senioris]KRM94783.1 pyruvate 2-oxoglutarate dehydrogenase complex [Lentilactobacillus senioris DSM 24302 = JCM 17472]